uniref:Acyl-CoA thioester hydrolase/bile acid-CoA amino acid N-acetyltransferase domain-containing protein n=1 Tax=Sus scrofa TaxID=9823 RepID=A0A8D1UKP2_PIG
MRPVPGLLPLPSRLHGVYSGGGSSPERSEIRRRLTANRLPGAQSGLGLDTGSACLFMVRVPTRLCVPGMAATVTLEPAGSCCWDEPVRIAVRGLAPEQRVTLRSSLRDEKGALFRAHARYCADANGQLDLARAPALGGSFVGLEPMGLFWALEPEKPLLRFVKRDVQTPFAVELEVFDGHEPEGGRLLGRAVHERDFLAPGVRREPVRAGRVRATLFLPPGPGPFPGIIDIFGMGGGLLEYRASLLAGHGFATLALAYYDFEDLPKKFDAIHLDYFEEALCYMLQHTQVLLMSFIISLEIPLERASLCGL